MTQGHEESSSQLIQPAVTGTTTATNAQDQYGNSFLAQQLGGQDATSAQRIWYGVVQNDPLDEAWARKAVEIGAGSIKVRLKDSDTLVPGDTMYDFLVACRAQGLEVVVLFNHESVGTDYANPDLDKCRTRAEEVVKKIGHLVCAWEVWNEPQSIEPTRDMTAADLMKVLGTAYPVFAQTGAPVLAAPEWVTGQGDTFREDMATWWNANRGEYPEVKGEWPFDIMAVHAYFLEGWDPKVLIEDSMRHISETFGEDTRVWVTEFGYAGKDEASKNEQSSFIQDTAGQFAQHENVERMFYYALKDYPGDESGADMGLFEEDGKAKPATNSWGEGKLDVPGAFTIPRPELTAAFLTHLDAIGAPGQVTKGHWNDWMAARKANGEA